MSPIKKRVLKIGDCQIPLSSIDDPNNSETLKYAQGTNQVSNYSCPTWGMVELLESNYVVNFAPPLWLVRLKKT